jgi:CDP-glucose 4,6-dehydratase
MKLQDFYKNKKVFITGHTGFKGCWLALFLKELGADVTGYSLAPIDQKNSLYAITNLQDNIKSVIADIRDHNKLKEEIQLSSPDMVFHLAAQPLVRDSYKDPIDTYSSNVIGTINLFDAILNTSNDVKAVINITTDKCYENQEREAPYKEDDKLGGHDPYSASKACSEIITASYRKSFFADKGIGLASARAGNVIGGGDFSKDRIIPDLIRSIQKQETTIIRSPNAIRPWQHVFDALYGYLLLGQKLFDNPKKYSTAYNFSPVDNKVVNVENLVRDVLKTLQMGKYQIDKSFANLHEAQILKLDSSKASNELNWMPKFNVDKSIEKTALWYKNYLELEKIDDFSYKHLKYYLTLI